jgi:hypothetical protein
LVAGCASSGHPAAAEVSSTTGPAVTARLDRCYIDPSLGNQVVADVTAFNHSGAVQDVMVTIQMGSAEGTHEDLAFAHSVEPGQSGTGGTSNHIDNSQRPTCVITDVEAI